MNVDVFEPTLDIVKLSAMLVLILQARSFSPPPMTRAWNYGIQKLVSREMFLAKFLNVLFRSSEEQILCAQNTLLRLVQSQWK